MYVYTRYKYTHDMYNDSTSKIESKEINFERNYLQIHKTDPYLLLSQILVTQKQMLPFFHI